VNDTTPTSAAAAVSKSVADHLHQLHLLPAGSFVDGYLVAVKVVDVDGTEEAAWFASDGFGKISQVGLLRMVQGELEG
jgi:hypothetical protein